MQEYEIELHFSFIRAGEVCSGQSNVAEASVSSLDREELIYLVLRRCLWQDAVRKMCALWARARSHWPLGK